METTYWKETIGGLTRIHEFATALLWDKLRPGTHEACHVRMANGKRSPDIHKDVHSIQTDRNIAVHGRYPDITLFDVNGKIIRVIEIENTSPVDADKSDLYQKHRIECIRVKMQEEDDLKNLFWPTDPRELEFGFRKEMRLHPYAPPRSMTREYDGTITQLCNALMNCSPSTRRKFLDTMRRVGDLEGLIEPISQDNPKREQLEKGEGLRQFG